MIYVIGAALLYMILLGVLIMKTEDTSVFFTIAIVLLGVYVCLCIVVYILVKMLGGAGSSLYFFCSIYGIGVMGFFICRSSKIIRTLNPRMVVLFLIYYVSLLFVTLFSRETGSNDLVQMTLGSFLTMDYQNGIYHAFSNMVLFVPLGILFPLLCWNKIGTFYSTMGIGALTTVAVESVQFFLKSGICDVDDILMNMVGTILGYACYRIFVLIYCGQKQGKY